MSTARQLTHGSLFAGIGGFDLGFERAGIKTVWQVEIDPFCRKVLEKNFPNVERFADVQECRGLPAADIVSGGFPCQDVSETGPRIGIDGERSGLWTEMQRIIGELRPKFAVVENVTGLFNRGFGRVLGGLAEIGYDCEWHSISAAQVGFPHLRERIWIIAYPAEVGMAERGDTNRRSAARFSMPPCDVRIIDWRENSARFRGVDDGLPGKLDRGCCLGNSLVPQIAEWIGRRIVECAQRAGEAGEREVQE